MALTKLLLELPIQPIHHFIHNPAHQNSPPRRSWPVDKRPLGPRAIATNPKCHPRPQRKKSTKTEAHHRRISPFETNVSRRLLVFQVFWGSHKFLRHKKNVSSSGDLTIFFMAHSSKKNNETSTQLKVSHVSLTKVTKRNPSKSCVAHHNLSVKCRKIRVRLCCQEWMNSLVAFVEKYGESACWK